MILLIQQIQGNQTETMDEQELREYIKKKEVKARLIQDICDNVVPSIKGKVAIFMAGAPGAGKTETAQTLKNKLKNIVHLDNDDIKAKLPGYNGANAEKYQSAATLEIKDISPNQRVSRVDIVELTDVVGDLDKHIGNSYSEKKLKNIL